jgi:hypothetical protein
MTDEQDKKKSESKFIEKRREQRFDVPGQYKGYLMLQVRAGYTLVQVVLANFSRSGILFESEVPFEVGAQTECTLSVSLLVARSISFRINVKYCYRHNMTYIVGAAIDTIVDDTWFDVFQEIHDFLAANPDSFSPEKP